MSLRAFKNTHEFLTQFDLKTPPCYENITHLTDCRAGFSVTRSYPANLLFLPAKTPDGHHDTVALLHIVYNHSAEKTVHLEHVPIRVTATPHSLYLRTHGLFDPLDPNRPTEESVEASRASVSPIPIELEGKYFFDHAANTFRDRKGTALTGREMLDRVFLKHCHTAHWLRGLPIRTRWRVREATAKSIEWLEAFLVAMLRLFCGQTIAKRPGAFLERKAYKREDLKPSSDRLTFRGLPVTLNSVVSSALLMLIFFIGLEFIHGIDGLLRRVAVNVLVVPFIFVVLLAFVDRGLPRLVIGALNLLNRLWTRVRFPGIGK